MTTTAKIELPPVLIPIFSPPRGSVQFRCAYGGRGGGKSFSFAKMAAVWGYAEKLRILCTRELQVSIKESFHAELKAAISTVPWLDDHYDVGVDYIRGRNGTEFIFRGLRHNISGIRSLARIDLSIVEEAEDVPESSWVDFEPTVLRTPKSEIWALWNPRDEGSPVDDRFIKNPPDNALVAEINWPDNPWFPKGLDELRKRQRGLMDPSTYAHVWEGKYLENSDAQILSGKWRVADFEPEKHWDGPYHGLDWGFSQDPLAAVRCWIDNDRLLVEYEAGGVGVEIDDTPDLLKGKIPGIEKYEILADNARPEIISHVQKLGLPRCKAAKKWPGSVEEGITFLRNFREIVIHPRCKHTIEEARLYSYKVDAKSGQVLTKVVDANNHYMDSIRYALQPIITAGTYDLIKLVG